MHNLSAQTATGSWYGRADVEMAGIHNNYLTELVIKQKGTRVEGIFGYYFRDKYQSFFVHGRYNPQTREVTILNIPVIYFNSNSTVNSIDCITNFRGVLMNSRVQSSLKGYFYHDERYKYMCPDLKVTYTLDRDERKQDSVLDAATAGTKIWTPQADDHVVDVAKTDHPSQNADPVSAGGQQADPMTSGKPATPLAKDEVVTAKTSVPVPDTTTASRTMARVDTGVAAVIAPPVVVPVVSPEKEDSKKIAESFAKRKAVQNQVFDVESDSVRLSFYDNGEIDGDSISVFVNKQVVLTHQELAAKALTLYLKLDSALDVNEISMFAENLGKYPPNTALMVVTDGKNRYEVFMSSSLSENATIQLRRKKKP